MNYLCVGFIYKSPRLSRERIERVDGVRWRAAAPPVVPLAFPTLHEAVVLTTESRDKTFPRTPSRVLSFAATTTGHKPAAGRVWCVLKMGVGSMCGLGRNRRHPALLPSMQHLRRSNNENESCATCPNGDNWWKKINICHVIMHPPENTFAHTEITPTAFPYWLMTTDRSAGPSARDQTWCEVTWLGLVAAWQSSDVPAAAGDWYNNLDEYSWTHRKHGGV